MLRDLFTGRDKKLGTVAAQAIIESVLEGLAQVM
jgi:hypothetical protein